MQQIQKIEAKDSILAIQAYVLLIEHRTKDPEILRMGKKVLLRLEQLKQQIGWIQYVSPKKS